MSFVPSRLERLREALSCFGVDVLCIRKVSNIAWLTGFERVFDEEDAHALFLTRDRVFLHSDSRYEVALRAAAVGTCVEVDIQRKGHYELLLSFAEAYCEKTQDGARVCIGVEDTVSLREYRTLENRCRSAAFDVEVKELDSCIESLREVKDEAECASMRAAQAITDKAFSVVVSEMKAGMSEREVQLRLDSLMMELGAEGLAFPTIVATGPNAASPHAQPGDRVLEKSHAVVMDFGARYGGYCSDMTRTVFVGEPSEKMKRAWEALRRANEECEALIAPGVCAADVHNRAEAILAEAGFEGKMGHSLGHSVGLDIHEAPALSPRNTRNLEKGNVVTVEPGIYIEGEFGMRLEDFGVVTQDGFQVFTKSKHDMVIIDNR